MEVLTTETFKSKIYDFEANETWNFKGSRPAIIDFYADWCAPCNALAPVLEDVAQSYAGRVDVFKIDTEAEPELAALFGIRGIPAILFAKDNEEPAMATGFMPRESFDKAISEIFGIT